MITYTSSYFETFYLARAARERRIPTLLVMDGMLEFRHTWDDDRFLMGGGYIPYFHPVECDKIAGYGWLSLRTIENWGNLGKCELVGAGRLDSYLNTPRIPHEGKPRIVVLSANTPGYTREQHEIAVRGFLDLHSVLQDFGNVEIIWRLRKGLDRELGFEGSDGSQYGKSLAEIFQHMDAAISQPSTVALEAMLTGLPTAIMDYPITPQYIYAAWHISDRAHIQPTVSELLNPPTEQLTYQTVLLRLQLECQSPALPRLHELIEKMVDIGRHARATNAPLVFPHHLLSPAPMPPVESTLDGTTALQIELLNLRQKHDTLKRRADMKQFGYWTRRAWDFVSRRV